MMKKLIPLILVLFGGAAIAADFSEVDTNQDGTISQEEAAAGLFILLNTAKCYSVITSR